MMQPASGNSCSPGKEVTQLFKVENLGKQMIRLRVKLEFVLESGKIEEIVDFSGFDAQLWS